MSVQIHSPHLHAGAPWDILSHPTASPYLEQYEVIIVGSCKTSTTSETEKCLTAMKRIKTLFRSTNEIVCTKNANNRKVFGEEHTILLY